MDNKIVMMRVGIGDCNGGDVQYKPVKFYEGKADCYDLLDKVIAEAKSQGYELSSVMMHFVTREPVYNLVNKSRFVDLDDVTENYECYKDIYGNEC